MMDRRPGACGAATLDAAAASMIGVGIPQHLRKTDAVPSLGS